MITQLLYSPLTETKTPVVLHCGRDSLNYWPSRCYLRSCNLIGLWSFAWSYLLNDKKIPRKAFILEFTSLAFHVTVN